MQTIQGYNCPNCSRNYKEKYNFDRHAVYCDFLQKSTREQENQLDLLTETPPTITQMYRWMQEMALRIDKLEKENHKLKRVQSKKINILEWLNTQPTPKVCFLEFVSKNILSVVHTQLETVYKENLSIGIYNVLCNSTKNVVDIPIRAFTKKTNVFYIFEKEGWIIAKNTYIDSCLSHIAHHFIVEFKNKWYVPNQTKIETEEKYQDLYIQYYQCILGGNEKHSEETRYEKIRKLLYKQLAENLDVIEYEII